jgi:drug/metabolite transporter (DMT)-like permease
VNSKYFDPLILIASVIVSSTAHTLLKIGTASLSSEFFSRLNLLKSLREFIFNPWLILGTSLHVVALFIWLFGLSRVELSYAYPFLALGYIFIAVFAWFWLGETISSNRVLGMSIVAFGLIILAKG